MDNLHKNLREFYNNIIRRARLNKSRPVNFLITNNTPKQKIILNKTKGIL